MPQMKMLPHPRPVSIAESKPDAAPIVSGACPFLDRNDSRCASRFGLDRLDQMLDICLGPGAAGCFMHHRMQHEDDLARTRPMTPTHDGQPLRLRPTGS